MAVVDYSSIHVALRVAVPEFGPVIDEHVAANGEVIPHVLFGDLTRFVLAAKARGDLNVVQRCLEFLDSALRDGDIRVGNLVQASFIENVGPWGLDQSDFIASWPGVLRAEAHRQRHSKS